MLRSARGLLAAALATAALAAVAGPAAAATVSRPLPASDYALKPLCGEPGPGEAACLAVKLVPQTAAARERATPIGLTVHREVEPRSATSGSFGLRPQDYHNAYSLPSRAPVPQTIAIVDAYDDPTAEADLAAYDAEFGLPPCTEANGCFRKVNQSGQASPLPAYNSGWASEIALDIESAHAICQENCKILLVEVNAASTPNLEAGVETAVQMGATEVSNSYGGPEVTEGAAYNHPGVAITVSTGDDGYLGWSKPSIAGHPSYPATSPYVVAVGGTRLKMNGAAREAETVWNDGSTIPGGAGAGGSACSGLKTAQSWQQAVPDWAAVGCGTKRASADIAADGDPYTGMAVYEAGAWGTVGGTSLSSPIVAATFALAGGSGGVDYPAQTLYGHLGEASALYDVTQGSNGKCEKAFDPTNRTAGCTVAEEEQDCSGRLICKAAAGYDGPTGIGTPNGLAAFTPPAPAVTAISPTSGDLGTEVTVTGTHLKGVIAVEFDGVPATHVVESSRTQLTVTAPGHAPGLADVRVKTAGGTSATSSADQFLYLPAPAIGSVEPSRGPADGGATVTIRGERLAAALAVEFGGTAATILTDSATEMTVTAPAHVAGPVDVRVTTATGTSAVTSLDRYTYVERPTVTAVEPAIGAIGGGNAVTVKGTFLSDVSAVSFGGAAATNVVEKSATELTVTSPAHAVGRVDVTVTTPGGTSATSAADEFEYRVLPVVEAVEPVSGPTGGGTVVKITGKNFAGATAVSFGAVAGTSLVVDSAGELHVHSPAHGAGTVDVTVTNPEGTSNPEPGDRFTYVAAPVDQTLPTIAGYPMEGRTLTEVHGSWQNAPTSYTYRWLRCDSAGNGCAAISGATGATYKLLPSDVGHRFEVEETAKNAGGEATATSAASAVAVTKATASYTWKGEAPYFGMPATFQWSKAENWVGGAAPPESLDVGTLTYPHLTGECNNVSVSKACYRSANDLNGLEVDKISLDVTHQYELLGNPIQLGAGGFEAGASTTPAPYANSVEMPIELTANQHWFFHGHLSGMIREGDEVRFGGQISGEDRALEVTTDNFGYMALDNGHPDDELGPVTFKGADTSQYGNEASYNGGLGLGFPSSPGDAWPKLNATDGNPVKFEHSVVIGSGELGPLSVVASKVDVGDSAPEPTEPLGGIKVNGALSLDVTSETAFNIREGGVVPDVDYTQISATGKVSLNESLFFLGGFESDGGECPKLPEGRQYKLIETTGQLEGTFRDMPNGTVVEVWCFHPPSEVPPRLKITYTEHAVIATVPAPKPANTARPVLSGTAVEGQTLHTTDGSWERAESLNHIWLRCDAAGINCQRISGAEAAQYTLGEADDGHTIRSEVEAVNDGGREYASSLQTAVVTPLAPVNASKPTIMGAAFVGSQLDASEGSWEHAPTSIVYQWLRCDSGGASCVPISGATSHTYQATTADVGHAIEVEVTATNVTGHASAASAPTGVVPAPYAGPTGPSSPSHPSPGPSGPSGSHPPPSSGIGKAVAVTTAPVKSGKVAITLRCEGGGPCHGTLLLQVASTGKAHARRLARRGVLTIGNVSFSIPAGKTAVVSVPLSGPGRALVKKAGKKGVAVQVAGTGLAPRQVRLVG